MSKYKKYLLCLIAVLLVGVAGAFILRSWNQNKPSNVVSQNGEEDKNKDESNQGDADDQDDDDKDNSDMDADESEKEENSIKINTSNANLNGGTTSSDKNKKPTVSGSTDVVLRFVVGSDTHIESGYTVNEQKMEKLFRLAYDYSDKHSQYKGLDAVVVNGDLTNNGEELEYERFTNVIKENLRDDTFFHATMGNHEFYAYDYQDDPSIEMYQNAFGYDKTNLHKVINGYHFLFISCDSGGKDYSMAIKKWLKAELDKAAADDPTGTKPIFVFQHHPISGTVGGTDGKTALKGVLNYYPQVVDFSSHTHAPINDPTSIWQGAFTSLDTGSLRLMGTHVAGVASWGYALDAEGGWTSDSIQTYDQGQCYLVEVRENNSVEIQGYDVIEGKACMEPIVLDSFTDIDDFDYTNKRAEQEETPVFAANAASKIKEISMGTAVKLEFPQTTNDVYINHYRCELYKGNELIDTKHRLANHFVTPIPETTSVTFGELEIGTGYTVKIYPVTSWANEGKPLVYNFTPDGSYSSAMDEIVFTNERGLNTAVYTYDAPIKAGTQVKFDLEVQSDNSPAVAVFGLKGHDISTTYYNNTFSSSWDGTESLSVTISDDMDGFIIRVRYLGEHDYTPYVTTLKNLKLVEPIRVDNPAGATTVEYLFDTPATAGQIVKIKLNVNPVQDVVLKVIQIKNGTHGAEIINQTYREWDGTATIAGNIVENSDALLVRVEYLDTEADLTKNVVTFYGLELLDPLPDNIAIENAGGAINVTYDCNVPVMAGQLIKFNIKVDPAQNTSVWVLGDDSWDDEYYAHAYKNGWNGMATIIVKIPEDTENFRIVIGYRDEGFDLTKNVATISNLEILTDEENIGEDVVLRNDANAQTVEHSFEQAFTAGSTFSFELEVNTKEEVTVFVQGNGESTKEYFVRRAALTSKAKYAIVIPEDLTSIKVSVKYWNADGNFASNVATISNIQVNKDIKLKNVTQNAQLVPVEVGGDLTAGQTVSFDIDVNTTEEISVWLLGNGNWTPSLYEAKTAWTGKTNISVTLQEDLEYARIIVKYWDENGDYTDKVTTISNLKVGEDTAEETEDIVVTNTIGNKAIVYQHDGAVTAGQTVSFGLEVANPTAKLGVFVFTDAEGAGANSSYYQALDPWNGVKDFNVTFKTSGTLFKIAVFLRDASNSNYNGGEAILKTTGMTISNLKVGEDTDDEVDDIVVTNTSGNKAIVYQYDGAVTAGQTVSFGLEVANPTAKLGVFVFTDAEGAGANSSYYQALDPWSGVKDFNVTFKTSGTLFKIAVFLRDASNSNYNGGEAILKTTGMTISNLKVGDDSAEEVDDIVVTNAIGNKAIVYQQDGAVTAGQTVSFGLEVANPTAKLGVFVFTDAEGAGANSSYYQALDPWSGVKDFNVTFKTSGTLFKIAVFLRDATNSNYNGGEDFLKNTAMTIKDLTISN